MMPIERMRPEDFDAVFRLLARSFPAGERRDKAGQRALLADSAYHIDILRAPSGGVQALMASWDFGGFVFFEHFAVDPACRNGGIGGQMLDALLARFDKPACLEAELPETELAARRIGFYERHGFTVNADYPYFQPALTPGGSPIPLHLLTTGGVRTPAELRAIETLVHTRVYGTTPAAMVEQKTESQHAPARKGQGRAFLYLEGETMQNYCPGRPPLPPSVMVTSSLPGSSTVTV